MLLRHKGLMEVKENEKTKRKQNVEAEQELNLCDSSACIQIGTINYAIAVL